VITGASRGIGREVAIAAAAAGARVALVARNEQAIKELATELGGTAHPCDLSDREQVRGLIDRVEADGGAIDVLVNNAGVDNVAPLEAVSEEQVATTIQVNLITPLDLCRQVLPRMIERRSGHIVNVSSLAAAAIFPGSTLYGASKAGLSHATEILRWELAGTGVDVTIVEPGPVPTDMLDQVKDYRPMEAGFDRAYRLRLTKDVPVEEMARAIVHAVEHRRRAVRLPRITAPFGVLRAAPMRIVRAISVGIPNR